MEFVASLRLLGPFEARSAAGTPIRAPGLRSQALLALLALKPEGWSREELAALLWHGRAAEQARGSLRQEVLRIRSRFGPILSDAAGVLRLDVDRCDVDVMRFRAAAADPARVWQAVGLYRGDLLGTLAVNGNIPLNEQFRQSRAELRQMAVVALRSILGSTEASESVARRLLDMEPHSDEAHGWLIRRQLECGDVAQALASFGVYLQRKQACGASPSAEIAGLVEGGVRDRAAAPAVVRGTDEVASAQRWIAAVRARAVAPLRPEAQHRTVIADRPSIAVLPVSDLSPDGAGAVLASGLTEELTSALARIPGFFVTGRQSALAYRDVTVDARDIAAELGVRYLLESSVELAGRRLRVNARLLDGGTGFHLWADSQDRVREDLFAVRDEAVMAIAARLEPRLLHHEMTRALRQPAGDLDAWGWLQRAQAGLLLSRSHRALAEAIGPLERALESDGRYAMAHALLSAVYTWRYLSHAFPDRDAERVLARKHADRALLLEPDNPFVLSHCIETGIYIVGDLDRARDMLERAVALNPNDSNGLALLGHTRRMLGDEPRTSLALIEQAARLSPRDPRSFVWHHYASWCHWKLHDLDAMERESRRSIELYSDYPNSWIGLVSALGLQGRTAEARESGRVLRTINPSFEAARFYEISRQVYGARFRGPTMAGYRQLRSVLGTALK